ncbi:MAG: hypothetical protein MJZ79_04460 [Paludibacteraceae bacterium]|nr:hypothetical protein [Paludibacteraceae bacterium]
MATMINFGSEMIRINPANNRIEYSTNRGTSWYSRCTSSSYGTFKDLLPFGNELLAVTSKGIYYSTNKGTSWYSRCTSTSYGDFQTLMDNGSELLAQTTKGLYYSTNKGTSWYLRCR